VGDSLTVNDEAMVRIANQQVIDGFETNFKSLYARAWRRWRDDWCLPEVGPSRAIA